MKKFLIALFTILIVIPISFTYATEEQIDSDNEETFMTEEEKEYQEYLEKIKKERALETNPLKKKAIAKTEEREKKYQEILKRKEEKSSVFQKKAAIQAEKKKIQQIKEMQNTPKSRFTKKAEQRAQKRALKQKLREEKLHHNPKK